MGLYCSVYSIEAEDLDLYLRFGEIMENGVNASLDLERNWSVIHYLLSGSADEGPEPLRFLLGGEQDALTADHVKHHRPEMVARCARALSEISDETLAARFDAGVPAPGTVYDGGKIGDPAFRASVLGDIAALRVFLRQTVDRGDGLSIVIC